MIGGLTTLCLACYLGFDCFLATKTAHSIGMRPRFSLSLSLPLSSFFFSGSLWCLQLHFIVQKIRTHCMQESLFDSEHVYRSFAEPAPTPLCEEQGSYDAALRCLSRVKERQARRLGTIWFGFGPFFFLVRYHSRFKIKLSIYNKNVKETGLLLVDLTSGFIHAPLHRLILVNLANGQKFLCRLSHLKCTQMVRHGIIWTKMVTIRICDIM